MVVVGKSGDSRGQFARELKVVGVLVSSVVQHTEVSISHSDC